MLRAELTVPEFFRCTTRTLRDVAPRAMSWVWQDWIPRGCLSLVLGEPGIGKSLCALQLAAMVTRGWTTIPNSDAPLEIDHFAAQQVTANSVIASSGPTAPMERSASTTTLTGTPGTVILFESGEGVSILRSRLDAAGADVDRIILVDRNWQDDSSDEQEEFLQSEAPEPAKPSGRIDKDRELRRDLESLEMHVLQLRQSGHDVSLVIIDPIESLLRDACDKHRLARLLSELADSLNIAIVAVGTTSSTPRAYPGLRIDGQGIDALFKASKTVITVVRDLEDQQQRIVLPTKLNLAAAPPGLTFAFTDDGSLTWSQSAPLTGQEYLAQARQKRKGSAARDSKQDSPGKELNRATTWLKDRLGNGGVPVTELRSDASQHGISRATLRRAYDQLGCVSKKSRGSGHWVWQLPGSTDNVDESELRDETETRDESRSSEPVNRINEVPAAAR